MVIITDEEHDERLQYIMQNKPFPDHWHKVTIPQSEYDRLQKEQEEKHD